MSKMKGACMCGQIQYDSKVEPDMTAICHCPDCQRQTGTSFSIVVGLSLESLDITGDLSIYASTGESGAKVQRHFCGQCGSPIYSAPDAMPGLVFLKAGTLDDTSWLKPDMEFFCDTAQSWCELSGEWPKMPRNPPLG